MVSVGPGSGPLTGRSVEGVYRSRERDSYTSQAVDLRLPTSSTGLYGSPTASERPEDLRVTSCKQVSLP